MGGTFTDLIATDGDTGLQVAKSLTTPASPSQGIFDALAKAEIDPAAIEYFVPGTTVGTNMLIERRGPRIGPITTQGFRDVLRIQRIVRPESFDLHWRKPRHLVDRALSLEVRERIGAHGEVVQALEEEDVVAAVERLRARGVEVMMLTGDEESAARRIASQVRIDRVRARVSPEEKAAEIGALREAGRVVAMVGDGINDAPALATADVGVAMGGGTDVALQTGDVALLGDSLRGVETLLRISAATRRNIAQNLVGAFAYNVIGIPVAAGVLYPSLGLLLSPMIAGAAMAFSSVTVVTNANRLRRVDLG